MECTRCGAYFRQTVDSKYPGICPTCVFQIKTLEHLPAADHGPKGNFTPYNWTMNDAIGGLYLIAIFFIGGGIWLLLEPLWGTGFISFVVSMFLGFCVLVGLDVLAKYVQNQSTR